MHIHLENESGVRPDTYVLITLVAVLCCLLVLVFQSFREPRPLEYVVNIKDARDPNGMHSEVENCINLYGPTAIYVHSDFDMPLDED